MKILIVEPNNKPKVSYIESNLKAMQEIVGGNIELLKLDANTDLYCNEEGKLIGLKGNRKIGQDIIAGTFFICGDDGEGRDCSLDDNQIKKYSEMFSNIENYSNDDINKSIFMKVKTVTPNNYDYENEDNIDMEM